MTTRAYVSVWNGKDPLPGVSGEGWRQRERPMVDPPPRANRAAIEARYRAKCPRRRCGCGNLARKGKTRCWTCSRRKVYHGPVRTGRPKETM